MPETYCGKVCSECIHKESLNCPGCKVGPGRQFSGDCEIAQCCREKGHEECSTCGFKNGCAALRRRENQPEYRKRKIEESQQQMERTAKRAALLGKWLWMLFWLIVPATIAGLMGNDTVRNLSPGTYIAGEILNIACSAAYGAILLKLSCEDDRYRTAGICALISAAAGVLVLVISGTAEVPTWSLVFTAPGVIVALFGEYNEYNAHSNMLAGLDNGLSNKWVMLWKWYIGCTITMFGSILVILIVPILGFIVFISATIGTIIVSIMKLVYLYRTAKTFREYPVHSQNEI